MLSVLVDFVMEEEAEEEDKEGEDFEVFKDGLVSWVSMADVQKSIRVLSFIFY